MKNINIQKLYYHARHRYLTMNNIVIAVALLIGASWAWASVEAMQRNYALQKEVDTKARQQKLVELETQNLAFQQQYYKSSEYQELALRERLGLVRPGEKVLILPPNSEAAMAADKQTNTRILIPEEESTSNLQQWTRFLLGGNKKD